MRFSQIHSSDALCSALRTMVSTGRIPHALLLHEDDGGGAFALVSAFLTYLYCRDRGEDSCGACPECNKVDKMIHPDIHYVFPVASNGKTSSEKITSEDYLLKWREAVLANPYIFENSLSEAIGIESKQTFISVGEARRILEKLSLTAVEGGYRTVVMYLPEKMNQASANALLKMIEEPPEKTLFILITHEVEKVLPTIFSRCLFMRVMPLSRAEAALVHPATEEDTELETLFSSLMDTLLAKDLLGALEIADTLASLSSRERQKAFCKLFAQRLRDLFLIQQGLSSLSDVPESQKEWYSKVAAGVKKTFPRRALQYISKASGLIERNVSQKILFTDLIDRLYTFI